MTACDPGPQKTVHTRRYRLAGLSAHDGVMSFDLGLAGVQRGMRGSTSSSSRSRAWSGGGRGISAGWVSLAGVSRRRVRAVKMSRPVGLAACPAHRPASLTTGLRASRTARSTRLKMSSARQMTLMSASIRRLFFKNMDATAIGPLKLW